MKSLMAFTGLFTANGLNLSPFSNVSGDHLIAGKKLDSKPGTPELIEWRSKPILGNMETWRVELGDRLVKAAQAHDAMQQCGRFLSFGDYSWCMHGMPREVDPNFKNTYGGVTEFVIGKGREQLPANSDDLLGLSFGIRTSDMWSELMSSMFHVRTQLFDCYFDGDEGPMVNDMRKNHSKSNPCTGRRCYTVEYEAKKVCNDDTTASEVRFTAANGKSYEPLRLALEGRAPLSTLIKMDVEGSEWASLDRLLKNEEDMAKVRTIDMEVHFGRDSTPTRVLPMTPETLTQHVEIMEKLAEKFAVTGSSLETYAGNLHAAYSAKRRKDPKFMVDQKQAGQVYTKGGFSLDQYTISFVNRQLL